MIVTEYDISSIYTGVVISMFDKIQLQRRGVTPYTVPIVFADKDRLHKHLQEQTRKDTTTTIYQLSVPALALSLKSVERSLERQTNRMLKKKLVVIDTETTTMGWNDTAVDFTFDMTLLAKSMTEMMHINEFVMSTFKNGLYYVDVNTPLYDEPISTPIQLNTTNISIENEEFDYGSDRLLSSTYEIGLKGILHNNLTSNNKVITTAKLNLYTDLLYKELIAQYEVVSL